MVTDILFFVQLVALQKTTVFFLAELQKDFQRISVTSGKFSITLPAGSYYFVIESPTTNATDYHHKPKHRSCFGTYSQLTTHRGRNECLGVFASRSRDAHQSRKQKVSHLNARSRFLARAKGAM
jgi:hypothetical protein